MCVLSSLLSSELSDVMDDASWCFANTSQPKHRSGAFLSTMVAVKKIFMDSNKESRLLEDNYVNFAFSHQLWLVHFRTERLKFLLVCGKLRPFLR